MPELTGSVGKGAANARHDVRLVQFMLRVITGKRGAYYPLDHNGTNTARLEQAIAAFQADQGGKGDAGATDKEGLIAPNSLTWRALVAQLPDKLKDVGTSGVIPDLVYLTMGQTALDVSVGQLRGVVNQLDPMFAHTLVNVVTEFHQKTGIVLYVLPKHGWWRSLDGQVNLSSEGGPGESIHHYGFAVDLGFKDWRWVRPDGTPAKPDDGYLDKTGLSEPMQSALWNARNEIAFKKLKLHPTEMGGDKAHIQAFPDGPVDSAGSWADLLQRRGPRKMKWETYEMTPTSYKCDLGLGGARYLVGTALDVWVLNPKDPRWAAYLLKKGLKPRLRLKKSNLAKALNAKLAADKTFTVERFLGKKAAHMGRSLSADDITDADMRSVHQILHDEFAGAAKHWQDWKRVFYTGSKRPKHDKKLEQAPDPD